MELGAASPRWIARGERSGLLMRTLTTESVSLCERMKSRRAFWKFQRTSAGSPERPSSLSGVITTMSMVADLNSLPPAAAKSQHCIVHIAANRPRTQRCVSPKPFSKLAPQKSEELLLFCGNIRPSRLSGAGDGNLFTHHSLKSPLCWCVSITLPLHRRRESQHHVLGCGASRKGD